MKHILGIGMQSGGTTVISGMWFKRDDTDGILDVYGNYKGSYTPFQEETTLCPKNIKIFHQKLTIQGRKEDYNINQFIETLKLRGNEDIKWYLIMRNPFHSIQSLKAKWYNGNWEKKLENFVVHYKLAKELGVPIIKYEDFLKLPVFEMSKLQEQLGVTLDYSSPLKVIRKKTYMTNVGNTTYCNNPNEIKKESSFDEELNDSEIDKIEEICKEIIREYGYSPV
tara:strand:+ start:820 stop:1491 length:672 start_codon:yes stop_codon:yes gene_type:complete